jgi:hypothetical protein
MIPKVTNAEYFKDFIIYLHFSDGTKGDVDLNEELYGELFEPLHNQAVFKTFMIHPDFHTLCWANGADFAPEFLYEKVQIKV